MGFLDKLRGKKDVPSINNDIHKYIGVSTEQISKIQPPSKLEKIIQKNINNEIKNLPDNIDKLKSIRQDANTQKQVLKTYYPILSKMEGIGEKMNNIYFEFDRFVVAINEKIDAVNKSKPQNDSSSQDKTQQDSEKKKFEQEAMKEETHQLDLKQNYEQDEEYDKSKD